MTDTTELTGLAPHKVALEILGDGKVSRKEISIALWARVLSEKMDLPYEKAYQLVKAAGRAIDEAGYGRYIEGRRGRESRFRAEKDKDLKELAKRLSAPNKQQPEPPLPAPSQFRADEVEAVRRLLAGALVASEKVPQKVIVKERPLDSYPVEELLEAVKRQLGTDSKR